MKKTSSVGGSIKALTACVYPGLVVISSKATVMYMTKFYEQSPREPPALPLFALPFLPYLRSVPGTDHRGEAHSACDL